MKMICPLSGKCRKVTPAVQYHCDGVHEKDESCSYKCNGVTCIPVPLSYYMKEILEKDKK